MAVIMDDYRYGPPQRDYRHGYGGPPGRMSFEAHPMGFFAPAPPLYPSSWDSSRYPQPRHGRVSKPTRGKHYNPQNRQRGAGYQHAPPGLPQLFAANQKRMRKFGKDRSTPRSVPPAPLNDNLYLASTGGSQTPALIGAAYHNVTPNPHGSVWRNSCNMDGEMLELAQRNGLDLWGAAGDEVLADVGLAPREFPADDEDAFPDDDDGDAGTDQEPVPQFMVAQLRRQLQEQASYIAELEDRNRDLDDKVYLLQQKLKQLEASPQGDQDNQSSMSQEDEEEEEGYQHAQGQQPTQEEAMEARDAQAAQQPVTGQLLSSPSGDVES